MRRRLGVLDAVLLAAAAAVTLILRVALPWSNVFLQESVNFTETDAWLHFRLIEFFVRNFPHRLQVDPYMAPGGQEVPVAPLFDWLAGGAALVIGLGHPSTATVAAATAWTPAVLGLVSVILIYLLLRRSAGLAAAGLGSLVAATMPGPFLVRTLLGFADHHALEACLSIAILATAMLTSERRSGTWWRGASLGVMLIAYRLAWTNAQFLVGVLAIWLFCVVCVAPADDRRPIATRLAVAAAVAGLGSLALAAVEPAGLRLHVGACAVLAAIAAAGLGPIDWLRHGPARRRSAVAAALAVVLVSGLVTFSRSVLPDLAGLAARFAPGVTALGVGEARPLLLIDGTWSLRPVFRELGWGALAAPILAGVLIWRARRREPIDLLLATWLVVTIAATLGQNRFGYYLVPIIAVSAGHILGPVLTRLWQGASRPQCAGLVIAVALPLVVHTGMAAQSARESRGIPESWRPAFDWLRTSTQEPFQDPSAYFSRTANPGIPASTVAAWWDYGYWISAVSRRVPVSNPTQHGAADVAAFFMETDESRALAKLGAQRAGHVVIDDFLAFRPAQLNKLAGIFDAIGTWSGEPLERFRDRFYWKATVTSNWVWLFYPDYFQTMVVRMGVFGGEARAPVLGCSVVSWTEEDVPGLGRVKVISSLEDFLTVEAASRRLQEFGGGHHALVSRHPNNPPVAIAGLRSLKRAFRTPEDGFFNVGAVQIFAVTPPPAGTSR